jgi:hypothetical protein
MLSCFFLLRECEQPGRSLVRVEEAEISLGKRPGEARTSRRPSFSHLTCKELQAS